MKFFIDVLISCGTFMDRDAERNSKSSRGRSQVLSWNKNKTRAKIVFQSLVEKRKDVLGVWLVTHIPASAETMDRDKEDKISASS